MTTPHQKPGKSRQDYETPPELLEAVVSLFGELHVDLAARADNAKAPVFVTPEEDSLSISWERFYGQRCWLNPPFADITPWAKKCALESVTRRLEIFMLTPASIGSNWFAEHVHGRALVLALRPRLTFVGAKDPYPKDCMLSCFGARRWPSFDVWRWA